MDIQLLILDIDGTLVGDSNEISQPVQDTLQATLKQGIPVAIATGRMYHSALYFHEILGSKMPLVAYNGAWIQNPHTGERFQHLPVPQTLALQLLDHLEQPELRSQLGVHCYLEDQLYVREITSETERYAERSRVKAQTVTDLREVLQESPTKILAMSQDNAVIRQLLDDLTQQFSPQELHLTQSSATFFEATHPQANKGEAVRYLTEDLLGLNPQNVMAIGDNYNDVEMLEYVGFSVAMENAPEAVKSRADWVTTSVEEEGVAVAVEKFLLS